MSTNTTDRSAAAEIPGKTLAVTAETLYLVNLLLLPGVGFVALLALYLTRHRTAPPLAANHLSQTTGVSVIGGTLIVTVILAVVLPGVLDPAWTWLVVVLYFTFVHSTLILLGVLGLVRALAGQHYRYPLLGGFFQA